MSHHSFYQKIHWQQNHFLRQRQSCGSQSAGNDDVWRGTDPVSDTHLDVYKRQHELCQNVGDQEQYSGQEVRARVITLSLIHISFRVGFRADGACVYQALSAI